MNAHTAAQLLLSAAQYRFGRKLTEAKTTTLKELNRYYNHTSIYGDEYGFVIATYCMAFNWPVFFCTTEARRW